MFLNSGTQSVRGAFCFCVWAGLGRSLVILPGIPCNTTREDGAIPCNPTREGWAIPCNPTREGGAIPCNPTRDGGAIPCNPAREGGKDEPARRDAKVLRDRLQVGDNGLAITAYTPSTRGQPQSKRSNALAQKLGAAENWRSVSFVGREAYHQMFV